MAMTLWYTPHHIISRNTIPFGMAWLSFYLKATLRQGSLIHQLYLYRLNVECFIQVWLSYYGNDDVDDDEYNAMGLMAILWCDWTNLIFLFVALPLSIPSTGQLHTVQKIISCLDCNHSRKSISISRWIVKLNCIWLILLRLWSGEGSVTGKRVFAERNLGHMTVMVVQRTLMGSPKYRLWM